MDNDIIDISLDFDSLDGPRNNSKSVNFGSGIELLMNGKKRESSKPTSDIAIEDLENKCLDLKTARLNCIKKEIELMENFDIYDR